MKRSGSGWASSTRPNGRRPGSRFSEKIQQLLSGLVASSAATGDIVDIYDAAGIPRPTLSQLGPEFAAQAQQAENPHLAIEALRNTLTQESGQVTRNNLVRQRAFSQRIKELMKRYTNQQLTSAEVIQELIKLATDVAAERDRGQQFDPPLPSDELAFYDAVSTNQSAVDLQGRVGPDRPPPGRGDAPRREDRLDRPRRHPRRRPRQAAVLDQTAAGQIQVPARQAAGGDHARLRADGGNGPALRGLKAPDQPLRLLA
jgi:hypothetical protein